MLFRRCFGCVLVGRVLVTNVNDEARWIRKQGSVELGKLIEIKHNPRPSGFELRHANVFQQPVTDVEGLGQFGIELGIQQVKEDTVGVVDSLGLELNTLFQIDRDPRVFRRRRIPRTRQGLVSSS
jgi:hypothetical protein